MERQMKTGEIVGINKLTPTVKSFLIETKEDFRFISGQYMIISYEIKGEQILRHYSMIQSENPNKFELCIKIVKNGVLTPLIDKFKVGQKIRFLGPFGDFTFKGDKESVFVATGTGVSTLRTIINCAFSEGIENQIHLIFGAINEEEIIYEDHFRQLETSNPNFKYTILLSQPKTQKYKKGKVQDAFKEHKNNSKKHLYICGLPNMVEQIEKLALNNGFKDDNIFYEKY